SLISDVTLYVGISRLCCSHSFLEQGAADGHTSMLCLQGKGKRTAGNRNFGLPTSHTNTHRCCLNYLLDTLSHQFSSMLLSANDGGHNSRPIDREFVFFANLGTQQ